MGTFARKGGMFEMCQIWVNLPAKHKMAAPRYQPIAYQGEVEHGDSVGNHGIIGEGDVQWMTAGRGIVHEEFHSRTFAQKGGMFEMHLWDFALEGPATLDVPDGFQLIVHFARGACPEGEDPRRA